tara:strand:- start:3929 stop:4600 length:672 start_codon:yes stop_codon:yes gene_type:complete
MHQKKSKKILLFLFLFIFIGTINNKNLVHKNFFKINEILIFGLDEEKKKKIIENLNFLKLNNLFYLNKVEIINVISANNIVESFSIFKRYPSSLDITIIETKFLAQLKKDGKNFYLGSNGKLIKAETIRQDIPFIFGEFKIDDFFQLKEVIDNSEFNFNEIKNLFSYKSGRWDMETNSGILLKLPKYDIKKSINLFLDLLESDKFNNINEIDLRQRNQIIINE